MPNSVRTYTATERADGAFTLTGERDFPGPVVASLDEILEAFAADPRADVAIRYRRIAA